jgi:alpha-glucosidase
MSPQQPEPFLWWKHGIIYHIYPRSFMDSDNDGIGDLRGIINKLPYLSELGIDAVWLSPVFLSPMVDFGYDVADYRQIDPDYGTLDDFRELLKLSHQYGIRVISDMILNHTSDIHPWFIESASSYANPKRDWYIWRKGNQEKPPNNWRSASGECAWQFNAKTGEYYYHSFFKEQPDLNWRNEEMRSAFFEELRFWLDLGIDGFRLDVINLIVKDKKFRNNPVLYGIPLFQRHKFTRNRPKSIKIVRELRKLTDQYPDRVLVGEVYTPPPGNSEVVASYLDQGNGIHLAFDFSLFFRTWNARKYFNCIQETYRHIPPEAWPCIVLSNHDLFRHINRFPWRLHQTEKAKVAAVLLLTLRGTPFIYYGEEIGMKNTRIAYKNLRDPFGKRYWPFFSGRDKARTPMQWDSTEFAGFSKDKPWLPLNKNAPIRNVELQETDDASLLNFYKDLIKIRRKHKALQHGNWVPLIRGEKGIIVYERNHEHERIIVILNFRRSRQEIRLKDTGILSALITTHRKQGEEADSELIKVFPFEATVFLKMD